MAAAEASGAAAGGKARADVPEAREFLDFVNASMTPFHAVASCVTRLEAAGFQKLRETDEWAIKAGGKYYFTRNQSTVFAFTVGGAWVPGNGFTIVAAHTDSPCLRVKPKSARESAGYLQVGVETYGGGLWYTWFDRDLSVAGRVVVRDGDSFKSTLVCVKRPILRVPSLAIHMNRGVGEEGFKINNEEHLAPVLATRAQAELQGESKSSGGSHHALLLEVLAEELGCRPEEIENFELSLYDTQPATIGGPRNEFIYSGRLDNLMCTFVGLKSLLSASEGDQAAETNIRLFASFDDEEVGSSTMMGAASSMMLQFIERVSTKELAPRAIAQSMLVSADMAHAVHPNYPGKHEASHRPAIHGGVVIKNNVNQRYATNSLTSFILKAIAKAAETPVQEFVVRQDSPCGSTIGPILATSVGMRTVDVGLAQLSMHSIREMCGTIDVAQGVTLFTAFYRTFPSVLARLDTGEL